MTATSRIAEAAAWLAAIRPEERPRPIVPALRERFGLTALEAIEVLRLARSDHSS